MPYGSNNDSGWKPGANKTVNERGSKSKNPVSSKTAASFANRADRASGYGSDTPTKKGAPKIRKPKDGHAAASFAGPRAGSGYGTTGVDAGLKAAADRRTTQRTEAKRSNNSERDKAVKRGQKVASGDFKGKFYGPDEFKGNMAKVLAWRKAGKKRNADGSPKV